MIIIIIIIIILLPFYGMAELTVYRMSIFRWLYLLILLLFT
jgi:hypothetical protein